jgi:predicted PhzF superfamily epimerase YddE/YHI9
MNGAYALLTIDAFTDEPFKGNPAAVCVLPDGVAYPPDSWLQALAREMNLSETVCLRRRDTGDGDDGDDRDDGYDIRWFTPAMEVKLCGHATLASAHALWELGLLAEGETAVFHSRWSGVLRARRDALGWIELDFPVRRITDEAAPAGAMATLGAAPIETRFGEHAHYAIFESESQVRALTPDFAALARFDPVHEMEGIVATAPGDAPGVDFVSRFFASPVGIDEDPVCGSAHCALAPIWAAKLGKTEFVACQVSERGGMLRVRLEGERVKIAGQAVTVVRGVVVAAPAGCGNR